MNIIHFTTVHPRSDTRVFHKECTYLSNNNYNVKLVVADGIDDEINNGVNIQSIPNPNSRLERVFKTQWLMYKKLRLEDAKVFQFHDPELLFMGLLLKLKGKEVIFDMHEDSPAQILSKPYLNKVQAKCFSLLMKLIEFVTLPFMSHIFTVNDEIVKRVSKINKNVSLLRNFPIMSEFIHLNQDWTKKENAIFYVGAISDIRGIEQLVESLKNTKIKLYLAGTFNNINFEDKVKKSEGWKNVEFLGQINREQMKEYLLKSKLGIIPFLPAPNHINANPNKFYEYLSAGVPIACSNFPLWKDFVTEHNIGITFNPKSPSDIFKKIDQLINNSNELEAMSKNAKLIIKNECNWEKEAQELLRVYRRIIKSI